MHQLNQNFRFTPLNFVGDKVKGNRETQRGYRNQRVKVSGYFSEFFLLKQTKKATKDSTLKKREMVLPVKGEDVVSQVYFQNRMKLRYVEYFQDQLNYLSGVLKNCMAITTLMKFEQKVQLISKQITFLRLEANKIKADVATNHMQLKEAVVNSSEAKFKLVERDEARISFDISIFLSTLANTKKDIVQLFKKVSALKQLFEGEMILNPS